MIGSERQWLRLALRLVAHNKCWGDIKDETRTYGSSATRISAFMKGWGKNTGTNQSTSGLRYAKGRLLEVCVLLEVDVLEMKVPYR